MVLRSIRAFNRNFDVVVERRDGKQHLMIFEGGRTVAEHDPVDGGSAVITLP